VVVDLAGSPFAFWAEFGLSRNAIWTSRFRPGQGWAGAQELMPLNNFVFDAAVDGGGTVFSAWVDNAGPSALQVFARQFEAPTGWSASHRVSDDGSDPRQDVFISLPSLAVVPDGRALMAWRQTVGGTRRLWVAQYALGSGWERPVIVDAGIGNASRAEVAVDSDGRAVAAWRVHPASGPPDTTEIRASVLVPGTGWSEAETIATALRASPTDPLPVVTAAGHAIVVSATVTLSGDRGAVWAIHYSAGGSRSFQ
jgi:hypothetical protein